MTEPTESHPPKSTATDWREVNREAILSNNEWVKAYGLPLQPIRLF